MTIPFRIITLTAYGQANWLNYSRPSTELVYYKISCTSQYHIIDFR